MMKMVRSTLVASVTALALTCSPTIAQEVGSKNQATPKYDLLDLANGAVVLSATGEYDQSAWSALSLIDGTTTTGWASKQNDISNNAFVIELPAPARLTSFVVDTRGVDGPNREARNFALHASSSSGEDGFEQILVGETDQQARKEFAIASEKEFRWLRLEVADNWGATDYSEIMELEAYGKLSESESRASVAGVYDTNYNLMRLQQDNSDINGCYDWDNGTLTGNTDGRVIRFEWREDGPQIGNAIMVLTADGKFLNGLWYEGGNLRGIWFGPIVADGREPKCVIANENKVAKALEEGGAATLYGIRFDLDSANLRSDSETTLNALLEALRNKAEQRVIIEGHTDAQGADNYNIDLSLRRADSVKNWLDEKGIDANRIETSGKGESEPAADNQSPQGRALNRRVVVRVL